MLSHIIGDTFNTSLTLEYMPNGTVAAFLLANPNTPAEVRAQWVLQAAQGVAMLHAHGVIHADLKLTNMVIDGNQKLRIIDFSGCSLLGKRPWTLESGAFYLPAEWREHGDIRCNTVTDLFALASCIFQIVTGRKPYDGLMDEDVEAKFAKGEFPNLEGVFFAGIIYGCWSTEFDSAEEVLDLLMTEARTIFGDAEWLGRVLE